MSTIRVPPNPVRSTTLSAGSVTISPTSAASAPSGCDRNASSPASGLLRRDDGDELALVGDVQWVDAEQFAGAIDHGRHRKSLLFEQDPEAAGLGQLVAHGAYPAARRITHPSGGRGRRHQQLHQRADRGGVGGDVGLDGQIAPGEHHRHAVIAHRPRQQHLVSGAHRQRRQRAARGDDAGPGGGDEQAVGRALGHHLGVAGDDLHAGRRGRRGHVGDDLLQFGDSETLFEHERCRDPGRHGAGHRQVVAGAVDGEFADGPAGKSAGLHHKRIRRHRHPLAAGQREDRAVAQRLQQRVAERLHEHRVHQRRRRLAARAVRQGHVVVEQARATPAERLDPLDHLALGEPRPRRKVFARWLVHLSCAPPNLDRRRDIREPPTTADNPAAPAIPESGARFANERRSRRPRSGCSTKAPPS